MLLKQSSGQKQSWLDIKRALRSQIESKRLQIIQEREKNRVLENEELGYENDSECEEKDLNHKENEQVNDENIDEELNEEEDNEIDEENEEEYDSDEEEVEEEDIDEEDDNDEEEINIRKKKKKSNYFIDDEAEEENDSIIDEFDYEEGEKCEKNDTVNKSEKHISDDEIVNNEESEELIKDKDDLNHSFVSVNSLNDSFYKKIATQNLGLSPYSTQMKCQEKDNESIYKNLIMNKAQNDFGSQELLGLCSGDFETPTKFIEETKNDKNIVDDDDDFLNTGKSFKNIKKFTLESDDENEDKNENKDENEDEKVKVESQVNDKDYEDEDEEVEADDDEREEDMESEEDEEIVDAKGFLDVEAELSGSEASADEDEDEEIDGPFEEAAEAEDLPSEDDLREQIGRLHHRQLMDQDKREVLLMQEMMFEDGDMHDDGRQREKKFRWQNLDNSEWQNIYNDYQSDSGESDGGEEEIKRPQLKIQYDDDDNDNNDNDSKDRISEETNSKKDIITSQMNYNTKKVNLSDFIIRDERLKNVLSIKRPSPLKPRRKAKKFKSQQQQQQSVFDLF